MPIAERKAIYEQIEALRGRPLLVYVTSQRSGAEGIMASDVIPEFIQQIEQIPNDNPNIDILIESTGGDPLVAWRIISLLRAKFDHITALISYSAFSAATLLALGCNDIIMGKYGCLGPIDPQMTVTKQDGTTEHFAYQDIVAYLDFVRTDAGLTEQSFSENALRILFERIEPAVLGTSKRANSLSVTMGEKLLQMHMTNIEGQIKASSIAKKLNESFFSHGHALSRKEANAIGLEIIEADQNLEDLIWKVHVDIENELQTRKPFNPIGHFLSHPDAQVYLNSPPPFNIPPNLNPQFVNAFVEQYLRDQLNVKTPDIEITLIHALVESSRYATYFQTKHRIILTRNLELKFISNSILISQEWVENKEVL